MKETLRLFKLLSDETRVRLLMLLSSKELCVCQLMGILGVSQPLVSRNLSLLSGAGLLEERKDGKLSFYRLSRDLPKSAEKVIRAVKAELVHDEVVLNDLDSYEECHEFQKKTGRCDMSTFLKYMEQKRKRAKSRTARGGRDVGAGIHM